MFLEIPDKEISRIKARRRYCTTLFHHLGLVKKVWAIVSKDSTEFIYYFSCFPASLALTVQVMTDHFDDRARYVQPNYRRSSRSSRALNHL